MIVTQLLGGLGNQLFQYAIGRALAIKHAAPLRLDTTRLGGELRRSYALNGFSIEARELTVEEVHELGLHLQAGQAVRGLLHRLFNRSSMPVIRESGFDFDARNLNAPAHCYLQGYWQSPKYFAAIERTIKRDLRLRTELSSQSHAVRSAIEESTSVSVHVRRGDYASNPATNLYHGTCDPEYYLAAERKLRTEFGELTLFVFSDDPQWAKDNVQFQSNAVAVTHNLLERDYEDLHLMTLCDHHIIANSTFSWWGAWLCDNPGKMVIAPRQWFRGAGLSAEDLIPEGWIRM